MTGRCTRSPQKIIFPRPPFFIPRHGNGDAQYDLRWFAPRGAVELCSHATQASAYALLFLVDPGPDTVRFEAQVFRVLALASHCASPLLLRNSWTTSFASRCCPSTA